MKKNKETEKAAILASISEELDIWLEKKDSIRDGYGYETEFMKLSQHVNRIMMQKSPGAVSCNRNKKKLHTCFGKVEAGREHVPCQHTKKFGMSSKLQEAGKK